MTLRQLEMFQAIVETGRFTGAAEKLYVAQPSISLQIRQLEDELGATLFMRLKNRKVILTEAGKVLKGHAEVIFRQCQTVKMEISALTNDPAGQIRIGLGGHQLTSMLPPPLAAFHQKFPKVHVDIVNSTTPRLVELLKSNQLDLGVLNLPINGRELRTEVMFTEDLVVVVSKKHIFASRHDIEPGEIGTLPLVLYDQTTSTRQRLDDFFAQHGVRPNIAFELSSVEAMKSMVAAGLGATIVPQSALLSGENTKLLHSMKIRGTILSRSVGLARPVMPRLPMVIDWMAAKLKERFHQIDETLKRQR
jgi:LysR family transcriptional regulator, cyn operon transcriptional activator